MKKNLLIGCEYLFHNHHEANIDLNISDETINKSIQSLDEPYSDPSVVPSYYLSELISKKYKGMQYLETVAMVIGRLFSY